MWIDFKAIKVQASPRPFTVPSVDSDSSVGWSSERAASSRVVVVMTFHLSLRVFVEHRSAHRGRACVGALTRR